MNKDHSFNEEERNLNDMENGEAEETESAKEQSKEDPGINRSSTEQDAENYGQTGPADGTEGSRKEAPPKKKRKSHRFVTSLGAGIIGSMLTLSVIPFTDYPDYLVSKTETDKQTEANMESEELETNGEIDIQQTAVTASGIADMVEKIAPAIVGVVNLQAQQNYYYSPYGQQQQATGETVESGSGSGVIFQVKDGNAFIVTNHHVIENAQEIEISLESGERTTAELVGTDALSDLAVLRMDAKYVTAVAEFGDSTVLRTGEEVIAIGNPLGLEYYGSVTQGIVSATDRTVTVETTAGDWDMTVIQTDAAINSGNSGGALMNTQGQVIGINSLKIAEEGVEGIGFAIPSSDLVPIINEIMETGTVTRAYLGVGLADVTELPQFYTESLPETIEGGIMVTSVEADSAASLAGLQVQDVITAIDGKEVKTSSEMRKYLYSELKPGDQTELTIYRNGESRTVTITLSSTDAVFN